MVIEYMIAGKPFLFQDSGGEVFLCADTMSYFSDDMTVPRGLDALVDADGKFTIEAEGIRAQFITYGAALTNLFVQDRNGVETDVVLGYDKADYYREFDPDLDHVRRI